MWIGCIWLRIGTGSGCYGSGNERWDFVKYGEPHDYLIQLPSYRLLKKFSV